MPTSFFEVTAAETYRPYASGYASTQVLSLTGLHSGAVAPITHASPVPHLAGQVAVFVHFFVSVTQAVPVPQKNARQGAATGLPTSSIVQSVVAAGVADFARATRTFDVTPPSAAASIDRYAMIGFLSITTNLRVLAYDCLVFSINLVAAPLRAVERGHLEGARAHVEVRDHGLVAVAHRDRRPQPDVRTGVLEPRAPAGDVDWGWIDLLLGVEPVDRLPVDLGPVPLADDQVAVRARGAVVVRLVVARDPGGLPVRGHGHRRVRADQAWLQRNAPFLRITGCVRVRVGAEGPSPSGASPPRRSDRRRSCSPTTSP